MADTELKYTKDHEVVRIEGGNVAVLGITEYAQDALGDLVFVELPQVGASYARGEHFAVVESVKTAAEVYTPVSGTIKEVNGRLEGDPEAIKISFAEGWIAKSEMTDPAELAELMDAAAYQDYLDTLDH